MLEAKTMAESKKEKGGKVDYGKLTADALNAHTTSPEFKAKWRAYLEGMPEELLSANAKKDLAEFRAEDVAKAEKKGQ
jgi:hypothetical protein